MTAPRMSEAAASVRLDGTTHWPECWKVHPGCAAARKRKEGDRTKPMRFPRTRRTRAQIAEAIEALGQLNDRLIRARCKRNRSELKRIAEAYRALGMLATAAGVEEESRGRTNPAR